jgi:RHS repeat-associated protein
MIKKIYNNLKVKSLSTKILIAYTLTGGIAKELSAQSINQSYVVSTEMRISGVTDDASLAAAINDKQKAQTVIQYVDGLGRPIQTVQRQASPLGYDIVTPIQYDSYGRDLKKYLPYIPSLATSGNYRSDALTSAQAAFYNSPPTGVVQIPSATQVAYAETRSEASPVARTLEQGAPGLSWKIGGHNPILSYGVNTSTDAINLWQVSASAGAGYTTTYQPGTLKKTTVTDEYGNLIVEFNDIDGRMICKKRSIGAGVFTTIDYIYDDLGQLRYVVPPLPTLNGANVAVPVPSSFNESSPVFLNFIFGYHYDDLGRVNEKKIPGQGWQYVVYNAMDQAIMSQNPNQKNLGIWIVTKYDALGRVVMTGVLNSSSTRSTLQSSVDASGSSLSEVFTNASTNYGYSHVSYPDISTGAGNKILTVNYYDSYDVISNTSVNPGPSVFTVPSAAVDSLDKNPRGMPVASLVNVLGTTNYIFSVTHFDKYGRVVRVVNQNFQGGTLAGNKYDAQETQYSFQSQITFTSRKHFLSSSTNPQVTINNLPVFDHMDRQILNRQQYITPTNTGAIISLSKNEYNELGQLKTKHLHSSGTGIPANSGFLQHVDYRYNSRGWLTRINNPTTTADETFASQLDLFGESIDYDQDNNSLGGTALYDGNIRSIKWQTKNPSLVTLPQEYKGYVFTYDALKRLTNAAFKSQTGTNNGAYDETINYDELGNILSLIRKNGVSSTLNNLTYNYTTSGIRSNKLLSVSDSGSEGYSSSYTYDTNGSLTGDTKKTITSVTYNEIDLPAQVTVTNGTKVVKYVYDAAGSKLERLVTTSGTISEDRYYVNGIEYTGNSIQLIRTPEGRVLPSSGAYIFEYNLTDHLGNVRSVFGDKNNDGSLTSDEITQTSDYYPFGREITYSQGIVPSPDNTYKYNGKEFQKDITDYDFGKRLYDPVIARWTSVDPLSEKSRRWSPYNYVEGNPLSMIDPDGMEATFIGNNEYYTGDEAVNYFKGLQAHEKKANGEQNNNGKKHSNPHDCPGKFQAAILADAVYGGYSISDGLAGYEMIYEPLEDFIYDDEKSGFKSALFKKTVDGVTSYVYATAGTDMTSWNDWKNNGAQIIGLARQYEISASNAKIIAKFCKDNGYNLTFVGHSLGGGMAALNSIITGYKAITFNAAGLSAATIAEYSNPLNAFKTFHNQIKSYFMVTDPLSYLQNILPELHPAQGKRIKLKVATASDLFNGHSIKNFIIRWK